MNIHKEIKSKILSATTKAEERKIGVEIESFYYSDIKLSRIPVNDIGQYSASDLLNNIEYLKLKNNDNYSYSLEPGGQLEWASSPLISLWEIEHEYEKHLKHQHQLCKKNNIYTAYFSVDPISLPHEIELIDSKKYLLMNDMFKKTGNLGQWMMRNTTSLQLNIDFLNEKDANEMTFIADVIQPLISILFSNAPFKNGELVKDENIRWIIWNDTDPSRCKTLFDHNITSPINLVDKYVDWLLSRNTIFLENPENTYTFLDGNLEKMIKFDLSDRLIYSSFRQIFTHVRLKTVLEVRSCDRQQKGDEIVPAAFLAGLLTSVDARNTLLDEILSWTNKDRVTLSQSANSVNFSSDGPKNKSVGFWIEYLCQLSLDGLDERSKIYNIKNERTLIESKIKNLVSLGTKTKQIQDEYVKSKQSVKRFIAENYLDLYND